MPRAKKVIESNKTVEITIIDGVIVNSERQKKGNVIKVTENDASYLIKINKAVAGKIKKASSKKVAKAKPPVDAER
tara:strand:+ start:412 stop:639 length:228 start_codon:yes stop_codon:yes gene_type:complete